MISLSSQSQVLVSQRYLGASGPVTLAMIHCPNHQYIIAMVPSQPSLLYVVQAGSDVFQTELFPPRIPHLKRYIYAHSIYQEDGFISADHVAMLMPKTHVAENNMYVIDTRYQPRLVSNPRNSGSTVSKNLNQ